MAGSDLINEVNMLTNQQERRKRTLTDEDISAIAEAFHERHQCQFTASEVATIREMLDRIGEAKSAIWKGFLLLMFGVLCAVAVLSYSHKIKLLP